MTENSKILEGISLYKAGDFSGALAFFLSLSDEDSIDENDVIYYIGLCLARLKRYDDALLYLEQVVTSGTNIKRVLQCRFLLALIYSKSGRTRLADFELNKLLEADYKKSAVYCALAYSAWENGEISRSLELYKKSLEENNENSCALNGLGYVLACENKDLPQALAYCKKALDLSQDSGACMDSLGWVYLKLGMISEAKKYLYAAQNKLGNNPEVSDHIKILEMPE